MGLDMYLERRIYIGSPDMREHYFGKDHGKKIVIKVPMVRPEAVKSIVEEVCYWRKCNAIHKWFVDKVQDGKDECQESWVSTDQIIELYDLCRSLLKSKSKKRAASELPPQEGFFFGSTDMDEYYWSDLEYTVKNLKPVIAMIKKETADKDSKIWIDYYYQSSW